MGADPLALQFHGSVAYLEAPVETDPCFFDDSIPIKAGQAIFDAMIDGAVDRLFDWQPTAPFAEFAPFEGYVHHMKKLFKRRVLASFDANSALVVLDNFEDDSVEGEKLYDMLFALEHLNTLQEEIYVRILSALKP